MRKLRKINKYKNIKINGFDSKGESQRYTRLKLLENVGLISSLQKQYSIVLQEGFKYEGKKIQDIKYIADFYYYDEINNCYVIEDYKSAFTAKNPLYRLKVKMLKKNIIGNELYNPHKVKFIETIKK